MAYNKNYYEDRKKDLLEQMNSLVNRMINDSYNFVREHEKIVKKIKDLDSLEKISK